MRVMNMLNELQRHKQLPGGDWSLSEGHNSGARNLRGGPASALYQQPSRTAKPTGK